MVTLHHAAALALVGWYLMMPPVLSGPHPDAPLGEWEIIGVYDKAAECTDAQDKMRSLGIDADRAKRKLGGRMEARTMAECVATDDPRLNGK